MKLLLSLVAITTIALTSFGQAPEGFKYQAVVRDAGNLILNSQAVGMQLTIQQGSIGGTAVYTETFATTTNTYGLVNIEIGTGTTSDDFTTIDWANGPYFIETAVDVTGGTSYSVMGTSQLMSVPYALYAKTAESATNDAVDDADADPLNEIQAVSFSNDTLYLTNGGQVYLGDYGIDLVDDADADPTNELNTSVVLNATFLETTDAGGTIITDLSPLQDGTGTDNQNISGSVLLGTDLIIGIEGGGPELIDLSTLQDGTGTDDQNIIGSGLSGTTLTIGIEGGISETVDLTPLQDVYTAGSGIDITSNVVSTISTCGLAIGDTHEGGIVFYLDASGCHGLISAPSDQSTGIIWYNGSSVDTYAYGNGIGAGEGNSQGIRRFQGTCTSCYASELCQDLSLGGYSDWYLPSKYELNLMYENIGQGNALGLGNVGGFASTYYWSSTELDNVIAWIQDFFNGYQDLNGKSANYYVRSVRAF